MERTPHSPVPVYDRQGQPITMDQRVHLHMDPEYRTVERTQVGRYMVSTVWLGIDHGFMANRPPVIFETMVFGPPDGLADGDQWRYCTEEEAATGHAEVVTLVRSLVQ